jgi:hypothetical protein
MAVLHVVDVEIQRVVDFAIVQKANASGPTTYQRSKNGNEGNEANGEEIGRRSQNGGCGPRRELKKPKVIH